jgi:hypothetical protein
MGDDIGDLFRGGSATWLTIIAGIYLVWRFLGRIIDDPIWKKRKK